MFGIKFRRRIQAVLRRSCGRDCRSNAGCAGGCRDGVCADCDRSSRDNEPDRLHAADEFLRARLPALDDSVALAAGLVERILREPEIRTVDELAERTGIGKHRAALGGSMSMSE